MNIGRQLRMHNKAYSVLTLALQMRNRIEEDQNTLDRIRKTTFRNELSLWPLGLPENAEQKTLHSLDIRNRALKRIMRRYHSLVSDIEAESRKELLLAAGREVFETA